MVATFADDTAVLASHESSVVASQMTQNAVSMISKWMKTWRISVNATKSTHVTFTLRKETSPEVFWDNNPIPPHNCDLGFHLDRRLTWRDHIWTKRKQLVLQFRKMYWLLGRKPKLNLNNKVLIYKTILKPVWTYGLELWGSAAKSNVEIIQRFQSKVLRAITNAPFFVSNETLHHDLEIPYVQAERARIGQRYRGRIDMHPNPLVYKLTHPDVFNRLRRRGPEDLW
ncbi:hypothetical protein DMENIID0001_092720 [Sergentomyia squamirostris]